MLRRCHSSRSKPGALLGLCLAWLLVVAVGPARAAGELAFVDLTPAASAEGEPLELELAGLADARRPRLWLTRSDDDAPKPVRTRLRILDYEPREDGTARAVVRFKRGRSGPGFHDLHVRPRGTDGPTVFRRVLELRAPVIERVFPGTVLSQGELRIEGSHFGGPRKPRLRLLPRDGGKPRRAKLAVAAPGRLAVALPKLAPGAYDLTLSNRVGTDLLPGGLQVVEVLGDGDGGPFGGGAEPLGLTASLETEGDDLAVRDFIAQGELFSVPQAFAFVAGEPGQRTTTLSATMRLGSSASASLTLRLDLDPTTTTLPVTVDAGSDLGSAAIFSQFQGAQVVSWSAEPVDGWVTITSTADGRLQGGFAFTLPPGETFPGAAPLEVSDGLFDVVLEETR